MFPYILFILTIASLTVVNLVQDRTQRRRLKPIRVPVKPKTAPHRRSDKS